MNGEKRSRRDFLKTAAVGAAGLATVGTMGCGEKRTHYTPITLYDDIKNPLEIDRYSTTNAFAAPSKLLENAKELIGTANDINSNKLRGRIKLLQSGRMNAEARNGLERILNHEKATKDEKEIVKGYLDGLNVYADLVHAAEKWEENKPLIRKPKNLTVDYGDIELTINNAEFYINQTTGDLGNPQNISYTLRYTDEDRNKVVEVTGNYVFKIGEAVTLKKLIKDGKKGLENIPLNQNSADYSGSKQVYRNRLVSTNTVKRV